MKWARELRETNMNILNDLFRPFLFLDSEFDGGKGREHDNHEIFLLWSYGLLV